MKAKENPEFIINALKDCELNGYLIFTDAVETREGSCIITDKTKLGVDFALREAGFHFEVDNRLDSPSQGLYWMKKGEKEYLRYFPITDKDFPIIKAAIKHGMKTRTDFFL